MFNLTFVFCNLHFESLSQIIKHMDVPSGTVTFLFSDIEGGTRLTQEFPDTYHLILEIHDSILSRTIEAHNGFIFKKGTGTFCSCFSDPADAVNSAVGIQKEIYGKQDLQIKVRIGIHSGEAEYIDKDYFGYLTLSTVQRVMSVASGGQMLVSKSVYDGVESSLNGELSFKDFGDRSLKDLVEAVHLYQIVSDGIPSDFPPIKSLDPRRNNLPIELTTFIGREKEIAQIKEMLPEVHLLSLVGFGGTGKTRLAIHIAFDLIDEFDAGVWFVELAQLSEPSHILREIASALNVTTDEKRKTLDVLNDFLREKELLLILDNCEHVISNAQIYAEALLRNCPKLKILVTSRESLNISGESVYDVPALSLPDAGKDFSAESIFEFESVRLFIDRALSVKPDFKVTGSNAALIVRLCLQLDGIPLALELAAARVKMMSVEKILERLNDRFTLLKGGNRTLLPRQQTLKALIDWSYDLLSEKEKLLCRRLSIFSGGWILEAAEKVCSDDILDEEEILDLLTSLADKSLIKIYKSDYNLRYTMLETIRKYGDERMIESDQKGKLQEGHSNYFYKLSEDSEKKLTGPGQKEEIRILSSEKENLRDSLRWSLKNLPEQALKMAASLGKFWELQSDFTEGIDFLMKAMENSKSSKPVVKARAILWTGIFFIHHGKYSESKKYLNECLQIFKENNDKERQAATLISLATITIFEADYENLKLLSDESLAISIQINNKSYIAASLQNTGLGLMQQGMYDEARKKIQESLSIYRELNDSVQLAKTIGNFGALEYLMMNFEKAISAFKESLQLRRELGDRQGAAIALCNLGSVAYMQKDYDKAERVLEESLGIIRELGDRRVYVTPLNTLGTIAVERNEFQKAIRLFNESIAIAKDIGDKYSIAKGIEGFAAMLMSMKKFREGCRLCAVYYSLLESSHINFVEGEQVRIEELKKILRENLDEAEFKKYWEEGGKLTVDEAIDNIDTITKSLMLPADPRT